MIPGITAARSSGGVSVPDPYFANVALLVHCDGTDGQTTFRDDSANALTVTRQAVAKVDQSRKRFGTGSVLLTGNIEGSADYLLVTHNAALNFGSGDWCVECWIYITANPTTAERGIISKASGGGIIPFDLTLRTDSGLRLLVTNFDASVSLTLIATVPPDSLTLNAWNHVAVSRDGANIRGFMNGTVVFSNGTMSGGNGENTTDISIGHSPALSFSLSGSIDEVRITVGQARYTSTFTPPTVQFWNPYAIQKAYRFYNDNGSESAMTAAAAQSTPLTGSSGTNYILRMQLNCTGNVRSTIWRLEYKKSTDSVWITVPIAAPALPTFQAAGTENSGTGAITVAWPTHLPDDVALLIVESCGGEPVTLSTPAGFAADANSPIATGAGTAGTQLSVFWCRATSDSMASPVVADPGDHVYARIITFRGCAVEGSPINVSANDVKASASTSYSAPSVTTTQANCLICAIISRDNDASGAGFSAPANASLGSVTERSDGGTTQGNGGGIGMICGTLATAGASGNTTGTVTSSINAMMTLALRPNTAPVIMALSANITAGGENTTARLTAPSGKTTGDFVTGRIWDNENGTDAIDVTADDYTELAWCVKTQSPAVGGDAYQFRVTAAGDLLESYAVTPALTI